MVASMINLVLDVAPPNLGPFEVSSIAKGQSVGQPRKR